MRWTTYLTNELFVSIGRVSVAVVNILAINPQSSDNNEYANVTTSTTTDADAETTEATQSQPMRKQFTIVYAKRSLNSTNLNKWRYLSITFHSTDAHVVDSWTQTLQHELNGKNWR